MTATHTCDLCPGLRFRSLSERMVHVTVAHDKAPARPWHCWRCGQAVPPNLDTCPDDGFERPEARP